MLQTNVNIEKSVTAFKAVYYCLIREEKGDPSKRMPRNEFLLGHGLVLRSTGR
jgi:hypothetical protein